jgi:WD40 repeat protein
MPTGLPLGVLSVAISPDDRRVLSGLEDGSICIWDVSTRVLLGRFSSHIDAVYSVAFTPDGHGFLSGSRDNTIKCWKIDLDTPYETRAQSISAGAECIHTLKGHSASINCISISPDGQWVASASSDHTLVVWDNSLSPHLMLKAHGRDAGEFDMLFYRNLYSDKPLVSFIDFSPAGGLFATAGWNGVIRICKSHIYVPDHCNVHI